MIDLQNNELIPEFKKKALPYVNHLYITQIDTFVDGDAYFPDFDKSQWEEISRRNSKDPDGTPFSFVDYKKL